jgi:hypothetical protein
MNLGCVFQYLPSRVLQGLVVAGTVILNLVLASMIIWKLLAARRALLRAGVAVAGSSAQFLTTVGLLVESALPWTLSIIALAVVAISSNQVVFATSSFFVALVQIMGVSNDFS